MTAGRKVNSNNSDWGTPEKYVKAIHEFFNGRNFFDPCSNKYSIVNADYECYLPNMDGLKEDWNHDNIYVNPPYGADRERGTTIKDWLHKCMESNSKYKSEILALIPVATNTSHWKEYIWSKAMAICFLYDTRLRFLIKGKDGGKGAPMACAMIYWGNKYGKFSRIFKKFGTIVNLKEK